MRVIVTGSRDWSDRDAVWQALARASRTVPADGEFIVVHGACPTGADRIAHDWALRYGATVEQFPANWLLLGKRAGPIRNEAMIKAGADLVLAFPLPGSRGTRHTIRLAREAGIPVRIWGSDE